MPNQIVWCDIPVNELDRAVKFYNAVLDASLKRESFPGLDLALLPGATDAVSGCLFKNNDAKPGAEGPLVYLNCSGRLDSAIAAVEANGGKVILSKHQIGPHGFRAVVLDSEGNRVALHSM